MNEQVYPQYIGAVSKDSENVLSSSSGGIFFELCKAMFHHGGVVYGAIQTAPLTVLHAKSEKIDLIKDFRKSKYLRSEIGGCYEDVKRDLESGKSVLFSGVGCQIAGLYRYLGSEYNNLLTCEVICHGMPIKKVWERYILEQEQLIGAKLIELHFRDKREGWNRNCIAEVYENGYELLNMSGRHPVHELYLKGMNMEKRCGQCTYQRLPRTADISLADFWGCQGYLREEYCEGGISLVVLNNEKGASFFEKIREEIICSTVSEQEALGSCKHLSHTPYEHPSRTALEYLIDSYDFSWLYPVFQEFGEIKLPSQLQILNEENPDKVIKTFLSDTHEVVYFVDDKGRLKGITTFGEFITKHGIGKEWINRNSKTVKIAFGFEKEIRTIFRDNNKINRIPIINEAGEICFEVRRFCGSSGKHDFRKLLLTYAILKRKNIDCLYVNRPDFLAGFHYSLRQQIRIYDRISFPVILSDPIKFEKEARDLFEDAYSQDYIEKLGKISPIVQMGSNYVHADQHSCLVNISGGKRLTLGSPAEFDFSIHVYGRCGAFGYAVEDKDTIPSVLQRLFVAEMYNVRVINHGLWGADDEIIISNILADINADRIRPKDLVVIYMRLPMECIEWRQLSVPFIDTTEEFHLSLKEDSNFYDKPGHMTAKGYSRIAGYIFREIQKRYKLNDRWTRSHSTWEGICCSNHFSENKELKSYIQESKRLLPFDLEKTKGPIGAIVMNCNPFTLGLCI